MTLSRTPRWGLTPVLGLAVALGAPLWVATPARAAVPAAQMQDLPPDHWAYKAIEQLADKYGVMEGFPDATFRGTKTVSRYELAAALTKVMQRMDQVAASHPGTPAAPATPKAPTVTPADRASVDRLKAEFKTELDALNARLDKDESTIKEIQDKLDKLVNVTGRVTTLFADETLDLGKDRTLPYISSTLSVVLKGKISEATTFDGTIAGTLKAAGSGDVPATMSGALGKTPTTDQVSVKGARLTSKIGATTINVGRFRMDSVGFGPYSDLAWRTGDFDVGVGTLSQDASSLRVGGDVGATLSSEIGPVKVYGGVNSNIVATQVDFGIGPVMLKAGYETDHRAITQNLLNTNTARTKTTDNAAVVLDVGGEGPLGMTAQVNATNFALTGYGGGFRASFFDIDANLVTMISSDPGQAVTVATYGGVIGTPKYDLPWNLSIPAVTVAASDNYTIDAPARADGKTTIGPGGTALGKLAGVTVRVDLANPIIPGLAAEYNVQAKLIEDIFISNPADPITSESILLKSVLKF